MELLEQAAEVDEFGVWWVRGKRPCLTWPVAYAGTRLTKYAAILSGHPAFDHFRRGFVLPCAARRTEMAQLFVDVGGDELMRVAAFLLDEERAQVVMVDAPAQPLLHDVWLAYLEALEHEAEYYPSTVEVMAIAVSLSANVRIIEKSPARGLVELHRTPRRITGPCARVVISHRDEGTVRAHFERLLTLTEFGVANQPVNPSELSKPPISNAKASPCAAAEKPNPKSKHQATDHLGIGGLSFLESVLSQLPFQGQINVWEVALHVVHHVAMTPLHSWRALLPAAVPSQTRIERDKQLQKHGLAKMLGRVSPGVAHMDVVLYVLDRCCGICDRDWAAPRLHCDALFIQAFANWSHTSVRISKAAAGGEVALVRPYGKTQGTASFCFEVAHQGDVYVNLTQGSCVDSTVSQQVYELILGKLGSLRRDPYWHLDRLTVWSICHDMLFVRATGDSDADEPPVTSSSSSDSEVSVQDTAVPTASAGHKRWRGSVQTLPDSPHPRAQHEARLSQLAEEWHGWVTVPEVVNGVPMDTSLLDGGVWLPRKHCFWKGCAWTGADNAARCAHVQAKHGSRLLDTCVAYYNRTLPLEVRTETVLNEIARLKLKHEPPRLSPAVDRRCLRNLYEALSEADSVETSICFSCACTHTAVKALPRNPIEYYDACPSSGRFLHLTSDQVVSFFGYRRFLERYGDRADGKTTTNMSAKPWVDELKDWQSAVFLRGNIRCELLCCPEDVKCANHKRKQGELCSNCSIPLCMKCHADLTGTPARQPRYALANDLWTGYATPLIYEREVTYLELLCASPCILGLICFILEADYAKESPETAGEGTEKKVKYQRRDMFAQAAYNQHYRVAVRGNATLFELPLEDVYREVEALDQREAAVLPRVGSELVGLVKVLVKSRGELPASLIAHATCRRAVVLDLLHEGKARGHMDFARLNMASAEERARQLPENGCIPELVHRAEEDGGLTKILNQKAATPHRVSGDPAEAFAELRPNMISLQRDGKKENDEQVVHANAWTSFGDRLGQAAEMTITTGTDMLDTFHGDFLSRAFPFLYKSQIGQPDSRGKDSYRKKHGGMELTLAQHANCMNRRVEHQYRADWSHSYTSWNLCFREQLNFSRMMYAVSSGDAESAQTLTPSLLTSACEEILTALKGTYLTPTGQKMPVKGDVSKLLYASGISPLARRLLYNVQGITSDMAGTHQAKRRARSITNSTRILHGISFFVTLSPCESQSAIFVRCTRLRRSDPFLAQHPELARWYGRNEPALLAWETIDEKDSVWGGCEGTGRGTSLY